jgi:ATP-dependent Clp protease ATP-binding subunit ClpA
MEKKMDILRRLTDKEQLERLIEEQSRATKTIDAVELANYIKSKVVGQDAVADEVSNQIRRRMAMQERGKPIGVFCFAGPPGVGKTYFAKVLAGKLYGKPNALQFFDMSQFAQPHAVSSLFGQAKGYVGADTYGKLTASLRDYPNAVILLDEFEKAHPDCHKRFLTAWNDGFVTETSTGEKLPTTGIIFILTTNAASKEIGELAIRYDGDRDQLVRSTKAALNEAGFAPEVLSRIDHVFAFKSLGGMDIATVVGLEIERNVKQYGMELAEGGIDYAILAGAVKRNEQLKAGGVREIARAIENEIADSLIDAKNDGAKVVRLVEKNGRIIAEIDTKYSS